MRFLLLALFTAIGAVIPLLVLPRVITVENVRCTSQFEGCSEILYNLVDSKKGQVLIVAKRELEKALGENQRVESYTVNFSLPGNLEVFVRERRGDFAVKDGNRFFLVDFDGFWVGESQTPFNLPVLLVTATPNLENDPENELIEAGHLVAEIERAYGIDSGRLEDTGLVVRYTSDLTFLLPLDKDQDIVLSSISLVLSQLKRDDPEFKIGEGPKILDLRFRNPVVRTRI